MRRTAAVLLALAALAGCGGGGETATTPVRLWFFHGNELVPVTRDVDADHPAAGALRELLSGPPHRYETALPPARLRSLEVAHGVATPTFADGLDALTRRAQAQLVYTLTQFRSIRAMAQPRSGERPLTVEDETGEAHDGPVDRDDYEDFRRDAVIWVEAPTRDSTVTSPVHLRGTTIAYEATIQYEVWSPTRRLDKGFITATAGNGQRGTWEKTLELPPGPVSISLWEQSAADGSRLHYTELFLRVRRP